MSAPDIAARLAALRAAHGDAELAAAWRAMIADAREPGITTGTLR